MANKLGAAVGVPYCFLHGWVEDISLTVWNAQYKQPYGRWRVVSFYGSGLVDVLGRVKCQLNTSSAELISIIAQLKPKQLYVVTFDRVGANVFGSTWHTFIFTVLNRVLICVSSWTLAFSPIKNFLFTESR